MKIVNAEDARKLYENTIPALTKDAINEILLMVERVIKKGKSKVVYSLVGKEEFWGDIIKELKLRKFKAKYSVGMSHNSDCLIISW